MVQFVFVLAVIGLTIYAVIDCIRTPEAELRGLPKPLWLVVIVLLSPVGSVAWLLFGHVPPVGGGHSRRAPRTIAPDDDPDFLASLKHDGDERT